MGQALKYWFSKHIMRAGRSGIGKRNIWRAAPARIRANKLLPNAADHCGARFIRAGGQSIWGHGTRRDNENLKIFPWAHRFRIERLVLCSPAFRTQGPIWYPPETHDCPCERIVARVRRLLCVPPHFAPHVKPRIIPANNITERIELRLSPWIRNSIEF